MNKNPTPLHTFPLSSSSASPSTMAAVDDTRTANDIQSQLPIESNHIQDKESQLSPNESCGEYMNPNAWALALAGRVSLNRELDVKNSRKREREVSLEPATPQTKSLVCLSIDSFSLSISPHASPSPLPHMKPPCRPFRVDPSRRMMSYLSAANREDTSLFRRSGRSVRRWSCGCDHASETWFRA